MIEMIKSRRSCRSYTTQKVKEEDLKKIVECGLLAPSAMNKQGIHFCVITNEEILNRLEDLMDREFFYHAPALIVVYGSPENRFTTCDGSCAMSQMYLAAHALGLGSCWINQLKDAAKDAKFDALFEKLGLKDMLIVGALAVGYADQKPNAREVNYDRVNYIR